MFTPVRKAKKIHLQRAAMAYLNQWSETDQRHMRAVEAAGADDDRLAMAFLGVAKEYRVTRAFGWKERTESKLDALAKFAATVRQQKKIKLDSRNADVWKMARHIGEEFPRATGDKPTQLSAATKILWFAGHHEVRIFDDLAFKGLFAKKHYGPIDEGDYERFAKFWDQKYQLEQEDIAVAIDELCKNSNGILDWTSVAENPQPALEAMAQPWFAPRVLDKYLWLAGKAWAPRVGVQTSGLKSAPRPRD